ncbi:MAG: DNA replication and repair protein RecF [Flavobacteriales bacterium]|nr:DNA replication and repair protein RecF [Flavobacteriales bacterium]
MHILNLRLEHFRNHPFLELDFSPQFNCISGPNGTGKTNLLDALHYICTGRSFFSRTDNTSIAFDSDFTLLKAQCDRSNPDADEIRLSLSQRDKKRLFRNGNQVRKLSDHFGYLPVVMITPAEIGLVHEVSKERRKFMDGVIGQTDVSYVHVLIQMQKALEGRNGLLKLFREHGQFDALALESYNVQLIPAMDTVFKVRSEFVHAFSKLLSEAYQEISGGREQAGLIYHSDLQKGSAAEVLRKSQLADRSAGRSTVGCHKDELEFTLDDRALRTFGSQGQIKTYVIALHLAAYHYFREKLGQLPLLLLDDIFEKIDRDRSERLLRSIGSGGFGQVFITDTDESRIVLHVEGLSADKKFFKFESS